MSYEERGQWVYLVVTLVAFAAYVVLLVGAANGRQLQDVDYVPIMLWTIGAGIAASIIGRIGVEIAGRVGDEIRKQSGGLTEDVRDRDIGRYGEYIGGIFLGVGMVVPFILAIAEADHFWIANAMYLVFVLAAIVGAAVRLIAYRRGF
jgi:drug/metabolite transporter (DMT)-like permease